MILWLFLCFHQPLDYWVVSLFFPPCSTSHHWPASGCILLNSADKYFVSARPWWSQSHGSPRCVGRVQLNFFNWIFPTRKTWFPSTLWNLRGGHWSPFERFTPESTWRWSLGGCDVDAMLRLRFEIEALEGPRWLQGCTLRFVFIQKALIKDDQLWSTVKLNSNSFQFN